MTQLNLDVTLDPHVLDQQNVKVNGRRVGYVSERGKGRVVWLCQKACRLSPDEKESVQAGVLEILYGDRPASAPAPTSERSGDERAKQSKSKGPPA